MTISETATAAGRGYITGEHAAFYRENGYLVYPEALTTEEVEELRADTVRIVRREYGEIAGTEPPAPGETDEDLLTRHLCIHFPHKVSPVMRKYLAHPAMVETLTAVIGPNVKCMQSMLFIKSSGMPGQAWHQDEDFIPTRDRSLIGAWIALDDATVENGCLWILPGSHQPGILWPMHAHTDARFDCTHESFDFPYRDEDAVPVEVKAGSVVFFNGYTLHRSLPNTAERGFRRTLVNHYMSAESLLPWRHDPTEPVARTDFRDIVMVAGKDPYAWRGTTDQFKLFLRPDGEGGCSDGRKLR